MNRVITDPAVRQKLYAVMTALVPLLVGFGLVSDADAAKYVALIGAVGGAFTTVLAALNTHTPTSPADPVSDTFEPVPADQPASDTKADAAGL